MSIHNIHNVVSIWVDDNNTLSYWKKSTWDGGKIKRNKKVKKWTKSWDNIMCFISSGLMLSSKLLLYI